MTAPAVTARTQPTGVRMTQGHQTHIAFSGSPALGIWEKSITPPGVDSGGAIPLTNMFAVRYRMKGAKKLIELSDIPGTAHYNPSSYTGIMAQAGVEQALTITFPTGHTFSFYGFLDKFNPGENSEGNEASCSFTIVITNRDPVTDEEEPPVLGSPP